LILDAAETILSPFGYDQRFLASGKQCEQQTGKDVLRKEM
jgi:hypothetical protein